MRFIFLLVAYVFINPAAANTYGISTTVENKTDRFILIEVCVFSDESISNIADCEEQHIRKIMLSSGESEEISFVTHWGGYKFYWEVGSPNHGIKNPKGFITYNGKTVISIQNK